MKIFMASISSFDELVKTEYGYRYMINEKDYKKTLCVAYKDELIDIKTLERYHLLKRDPNGTLAEEEFDNIKLNVRYALRCEEMDKSLIPLYDDINAKKASHKIKQLAKSSKR